jgi:anhydro-N-acetylmuramic acid kinase
MPQKKSLYRALGVMSGTSLDGLDMAICTFWKEEHRWGFSIEHATTLSFPQDLLLLLKKAYSSTAMEMACLHSLLGKFIGESAREFLQLKRVEVDLIASHGHTIFHAPEAGYSFQIGNGAEIAAKTGVVTVCDFRSLDVARGGQGAPLVPIGDKLLFSEYSACLNLGGFANISYNGAAGRRQAYDICPVNFVFNRLVNRLDMNFDRDGKIALSGKVIPDLFDALNGNQYYSKEAPKSLGQEWVEANVFPLLTADYSVKDCLRTYCEHAVEQIAKAFKKIEGNKVLVTGGGAYNKFFMDLLRLKTEKEILVPDKRLIDMKEALIFGFLGVLRLRGEVNSLASVTGAMSNSVNGAVYLPS